METTTLALSLPGQWEWLIILGIGLLLFGKRLPEVGRSLGKGIVEFKRGLKDIGDEVETESSKPAPRPREIAEAPAAQALPNPDERRVVHGAHVDQPRATPEPQGNG
ncbi:MAG TPA: twin-arginine translocase TatA/TatE family subunit [Phycisphaerales bacterium]|nr:twin-arginine translocase TatA/TatE family subunit [Phycisphaerales bacterium]